MVPSAFRLAALALLAAAATLFALPSLRPGTDPARADDSRTAVADAGTQPASNVTPLVAPQRLVAREVTDEPPRRPRPRTHAIARVRTGHTIVLRSKPGGHAVGRLGARTEFGSGRVLAVAARHGRWLGVLVPERPNGKLGWVDGRSRAIGRATTKVSLRADLSERRVELRIGKRVVKRMKVAIGRPGSSTPTGRFAVTDKMAGNRFGPYYGCCILALSGHQPNTPGGWKGGNRLAIHGTDKPGLIGAAASAGCLRGADADLRTLIRRVPVGTTILIRR
jgi:lipoprotein-anchoring transpeptidase ErfK/SrfK